MATFSVPVSAVPSSAAAATLTTESTSNRVPETKIAVQPTETQTTTASIQLLNSSSIPTILTYIPANLPAGAILSPQFMNISTATTRLPLIAQQIVGLNPQLGGGIPQIIALPASGGGAAATAIPMINIQVPKTQSPARTNATS